MNRSTRHTYSRSLQTGGPLKHVLLDSASVSGINPEITASADYGLEVVESNSWHLKLGRTRFGTDGTAQLEPLQPSGDSTGYTSRDRLKDRVSAGEDP